MEFSYSHRLLNTLSGTFDNEVLVAKEESNSRGLSTEDNGNVSPKALHPFNTFNNLLQFCVKNVSIPYVVSKLVYIE